ncbi:MAG TPA: hypothetical protein VGX92_09485 [Pyrinomonadaceae bacterium]|jgi:hypothetical protein|nr:hypothetical protein [Pyrinomonadaceae bacterium]
MRRPNAKSFLFLITIALLIFTTITVTRSQKQDDASNRSQRIIEENEIPIADFTSPEPIDTDKRAKRHAKSKKYDKSHVIDPTDTISGAAVKGDAVDTSLPAFPIPQSNVVVIGEIIDARAYLSNDKTGVYSEFGIRVDEIFKNDTEEPLTIGSMVEAEREGGRVRFPSGRIFVYRIAGERMPRAGRRYLLFLTSAKRGEGFHLLTGYELHAGKISSLDDLPHSKAYEGTDEITFLDELRRIIDGSSQASVNLKEN